MTSREDLDKLFEAALHEKQAPSRFGTPEEQRRRSPIPVAPPGGYQQPAPQAFQAAPLPEGYVQQAPQAAPQQFAQPSPQQYAQPAPQQYAQAAPPMQAAQPQYAQAAPAVVPASKSDLIELDERGAASLDNTISAELGAIMDAKVAKEKRKKRNGRLVLLGLFLGATGGASAWVVTNPERVEAFKAVAAEIRSVGDIQGMVAKYQKALDKIAVRGEQIDAATVSMGVDPASAEGMADQGFDKEMREMMGEDGGPTTAARNAKLQEKFKDVQESGSLMNRKKE